MIDAAWASYLIDWAGLLLRWAHFVVGIAWIGSSFYFMWLDAQLNRPPQDPESDRVDGDLWAVHGGGFYHAQKYLLGPGRIPAPLHWFKWEAYSTWLTGFALLVVVYYLRPELYLVDPAVSPLTGVAAVGVSLALLVVGWVVYDALCRSGLGDGAIAAAGLVLLAVLVYGLSTVFSGRGLYMQTGAMLGTLMAANVLMVIIPGQRKTVDAIARGEAPDPEHGRRGKQRSMHNNYLTLPVLFVMLSSHYPMTWGHGWNWLVLLALFAVGGVVRHFFNRRNAGHLNLVLPAAAIVGVIVLAVAIAPAGLRSTGDATSVGDSDAAVSLSVVTAIVVDRCAGCHAAEPTHPTAPVAPKGVMLDTPERVQQQAAQIYEQTVVTRAMPLANLTAITEAERDVIAAWYGAIVEQPAP